MGARAAKFRAYAFFEHARIVARTVATPASTCRRGNAGRPVGEISSRRVEAVTSLAAGAGHLIAHQRATPPSAVRIEHEHERRAGSGADEHTSRIHEVSSSRSTRNTGTRKARPRTGAGMPALRVSWKEHHRAEHVKLRHARPALAVRLLQFRSAAD